MMHRISAMLFTSWLFAACTGTPGSPNLAPDAARVRQAAGAAVPVVAGCRMFPAPVSKPQGESWWNVDVSNYPVDPKSATYIAHLPGNLHPDFGHEPYYGIPMNIVPANQPRVPVRFSYASSSNPGPYPIPPNAQIEGFPRYHGGDLHVLILQKGTCKLYEMWNSHEHDHGRYWTAGSGAVFDLNSNELRPNGWTSADAAGLPITPALVKCQEVQAGVIDHALRVTFQQTYAGYIHPATHQAGIGDPNYPPMGARIRLKASYDISRFNRVAQIILTAMKHYGLLVADNGSNWYFQGQGGTQARCWNDSELDQLKRVPGTAFEFVRTGPILH
jgi:hypothetical protein